MHCNVMRRLVIPQRACSGGMKPKVPIIVLPSALIPSRTAPKSTSVTIPLARSYNTLLGFRSRCTTGGRRACRYESTSSSRSAIASISGSSGRHARLSTRDCSVAPGASCCTSTYTRSVALSISNESSSAGMPGCDRLRSRRASRSNSSTGFHLPPMPRSDICRRRWCVSERDAGCASAVRQHTAAAGAAHRFERHSGARLRAGGRVAVREALTSAGIGV